MCHITYIATKQIEGEGEEKKKREKKGRETTELAERKRAKTCNDQEKENCPETSEATAEFSGEMTRS